jgi:hypothetical protein
MKDDEEKRDPLLLPEIPPWEYGTPGERLADEMAIETDAGKWEELRCNHCTFNTLETTGPWMIAGTMEHGRWITTLLCADCWEEEVRHELEKRSPDE